MTEKVIYNVNIRLLSDMHISGGISADGVRLAAKRDNKPFIPASALKGIVRSNFEMLLYTFGLDCQRISAMYFGSSGFNLSRAVFDDLFSSQETVMGMRTNISVNRYTRCAQNGGFFLSETVSCYDKKGEPVVFSGQITVRYTEEMKKYEKCFLEAFRLINAVGTDKSRGLGFTEVDIHETSR